MARTRKRFWAWTLTLTAALLAVVWVGSMRYTFTSSLMPKVELRVAVGLAGFIEDPQPRKQFAVSFWDAREWRLQWWVCWEPIAVGIPLWPFVLLTGVPGVWMLVKARKHTNPNACPACGYDRTGLPQSSTGPAPCPECGKSA